MTRALILTIILVAVPVAAEPLTKSSVLPVLEMSDQHGEPRTIDRAVRAILFARGMDSAGLLEDALDESGAELLENSGSVYVADMSRMPRMIRWMFALPSLRRRDYPILLDLDGSVTADFPSAEAKVTLIELEALRVTKVLYFAAAGELREALEARRQPTPAD